MSWFYVLSGPPHTSLNMCLPSLCILKKGCAARVGIRHVGILACTRPKLVQPTWIRYLKRQIMVNISWFTLFVRITCITYNSISP